jgi:hypothetical protein
MCATNNRMSHNENVSPERAIAPPRLTEILSGGAGTSRP